MIEITCSSEEEKEAVLYTLQLGIDEGGCIKGISQIDETCTYCRDCINNNIKFTIREEKEK